MRAWASFFLCLRLAGGQVALPSFAANDDKPTCPGNGKKPRRADRLTRLAAHYNGERCKAAILAEDLPRWIANNAGPKTLSNGVEVVAVSSLSSCSIAYIRNPTRGRRHAPRMFLGPQALQTGDDTLASRARALT